MKIHGLTTGAVRVKQSFLYPGHGTTPTTQPVRARHLGFDLHRWSVIASDQEAPDPRLPATSLGRTG